MTIDMVGSQQVDHEDEGLNINLMRKHNLVCYDDELVMKA